MTLAEVEFESKLRSVFMLRSLAVDFDDADCAVRIRAVGESRAARQSPWPTYDPGSQFELEMVARGVRRLRFFGEFAGRPGVEGLSLQSLRGRQYESLCWRISDVETSVFELWCTSVEFAGNQVDPHSWPSRRD